MRKSFMLFLTVCLVFVSSVSLAETSSMDAVIATVESQLSTEGFDYYSVDYNPDMNCLNIHVAIDGLASSMIAIKNAGYGVNFPAWIQIKGSMITFVEEVSTHLKSVGSEDTNVIFTLENDDWRIREDYSGAQYANLFTVSSISIEMGFVIYDIME